MTTKPFRVIDFVNDPTIHVFFPDTSNNNTLVPVQIDQVNIIINIPQFDANGGMVARTQDGVICTIQGNTNVFLLADTELHFVTETYSPTVFR